MNRGLARLIQETVIGKQLRQASSTFQQMSNPVETSIREKLDHELTPLHLDVINESYMHNVPKGSESHFKVVVVSDKFTGLPRIKMHRLVNGILQDELEKRIHALSIIAKTPEQWEDSNKTVPKSPPCRGGSGL